VTVRRLSSASEEMRFGHLTIRFDDRLLRPREWTAAQSEWAAELVRLCPPGAVLELCAGAGQIGLLAVALEPRPLVCVDLNPAAAEHIRSNAAMAGLATSVEVRTARLEDALADDERFALVIADPPWVPRAEVGRFPEDPVLAIDGGEDGLDLARTCARLASRHLVHGGAALLQLGSADQVDALAADLPPGLVCGEVRTFERGIVVRLDRVSRA
jgi:methylase of polypeptide subunit release factors